MRSVLALALLLSLPVEAAILEGKIVGVHDGDTVTLLDASKTQYRIRLTGIDAPESDQAFGERSKQALSRQVFGKVVRIEYTKRDRYHRILGKILLTGADINITQVESGMAWHFKKYESDQSPSDRAKYSGAEVKARAAKLGLWLDKAPTPPWDFRKAKRGK